MDADQFIRCDNIVAQSSTSFAKASHHHTSSANPQSATSALASTSTSASHSANNSSDTNTNKISYKIKQFYYEEFEQITKSFKRGKVFSLFIFNLGWLQQVSLLFNARVQSLISSDSSQNIPSQIYSILSYLRIEPLVNEMIKLSYIQSDNKGLSKYIVLISLLSLMTLFLAYMCIRLLIYVINKQNETEALVKRLHKMHIAEENNLFHFSGSKYGSSTNSSSTNSSTKERINSVFHYLDSAASLYYQSFPYVFFVPAAQIFSEIYNDQLSTYGSTLASISILTFTIHLFILIVYVIHDYDYEIAYTDYLSKRDSLWGYYHIFVQTIMATFYNTEWGLGITMFHWVTKVFSHFALALIAYLVIVLNLRQRTIVSLLYLVLIPLAFQLGDFMFIRTEQRVRNMYKNSTQASRIDRYVRYLNSLYSMEYNMYTRLEFGVTFESIYVDHIEKCVDPACFCSQYQQRPFKWENLIQSDERSSFLENIIVNILESVKTSTSSVVSSSVVIAHKKNRNTDNDRLRFTYLQFLIEKVPNPAKPFTQIVNSLKNKETSSMKEKYILNLIMRRCLAAHSSYFNNSSLQNQRLPMMAVISFDQILENSLNLFKEVLYEVRSFYNFLCSDYIDLQILYTNGQFLLKRRRQLEINVKLLFDINPKSDLLYSLAEGYMQFLDLKSHRIKYLKRRSLDLLHRNRIKTDLEINLTSKDSCIVYISLLTSSGNIKHLTQSFSPIFGMPVKNTIGKSVSILMADIFGQDHDSQLQRFVSHGPQIMSQQNRQNLFGKNSLGFIFPINLRIRLNYIGNEDFGVCGHIVKLTDCTSEFVTLDSELNLSDVSRRFFNTTFKHAFQKELTQIKKVNLSRILPVLGSLVEVNYLHKRKSLESTLMVIPNKLKQLAFFKRKSSSRKDHMMKYVAELHPNRFQYFNVSVVFSSRQSPNGSVYRICEFKSITLLSKVSEQRSAIKEFLSQYNFNFCSNLTIPSAFGEASNDEDDDDNHTVYGDSQAYVDQSQMIYSSNSLSEDLVQQKRTTHNHLHPPHHQQFRNKIDFASLKIPMLRHDHNNQQTKLGSGVVDIDLLNEKSSFPMLTSVYSLVRKFIRNLNQSIGKQDHRRMNSSRNLNHFKSNTDSNDNKVSQSEIPTDLVLSSTYKNTNTAIVQQQRTTAHKTVGVAGKSQTPSHPTQQQTTSMNTFQQRSNINAAIVASAKRGDKFGDKIQKSSRKRINSIESGSEYADVDLASSVGGVRQFQDFKSSQHYQLAIIEEGQNGGGGVGAGGFASAAGSIGTLPGIGYTTLNSPAFSDNQINLFSQRALISEFSGRFDFSGRQDLITDPMAQNQDQQVLSYEREKTHTIDKPYINISVQKNNVSKDFTSSLFQIEDTGCMLSPKQRTEISSYVNRKDESIENSHTKQQKFYDQVSGELRQQRSSSLLETLSPSRHTRLQTMKRSTKNQLSPSKKSSSVLQLPSEKQRGTFNLPSTERQRQMQRQNTIHEGVGTEENDENTSRKKKNTETIFEGIEQPRQDKANDQQSVKSALSQTQAKKLQVIDSICTKKRSILITTIQLSGLAAFLFMVTVSLGIFIYLNTIFQDNVRDFNNLLVGPELQSNYANILKEEEIIHFQSLGLFSDQSDPYLKEHQSNTLVEFLAALKDLFYERSTVNFSVYVNTSKIEIDDLLLPDQRDSTSYDSQEKKMSFLINYASAILYTHLQSYVNRETTSPNSVRFIEKNIVVFWQEFDNLSTMSKEQSVYEVLNMEDNIILTIAIMEAVAIIVLALGLPIYARIMSAKQKWLALFATWPQTKMHEMIDNIDKYIALEYGGLKPLNRNNNGKRKALSSTTNLNKCSSLLTLSLFVCIVLVSIYPMMNLIYARDFVREFNFSISEITTIYTTRASIDSEIALSLLSARLLADDLVLSYELSSYLSELHEENKKHIIQLYEISEHFTETRFQESAYYNFLIPALETNACDALAKNTNYFPQKSQINIGTCSTVYNQILSKGIVATLKVLETQLQTIQEIIKIGSNDFLQDFTQWATESDLNGMVNMHRQLSDSFDALRIFLIAMTEDYNASITNTQFWLLFYSLFILVTIFVVGFNFFVQALSNYLYKTRILMTLFKVEDLLENSYIMRFLSDHLVNLRNT